MADECDRAQVINEQFQAEALKNRPAPGPRPSRTHCIDCEEPIPEARRNAVPGCMRCIGCQAELERKRKHWRTT